MEYVTLGKTGLTVSRLGFGGIPIQRIDSEGTKTLFDSLISEGINFIDTARGYTVSEEYIGYAIKGRREKFVIATKSMARDRARMAADIDTSLQKLGVDYIDLYQVHNATPEQLDRVCGEDGALEALYEARKAGKIGHIGLTSHSLDTFRRALSLPWVETFMFPYNIVEEQAEDLIAQCGKCGIAFISMKPLAGGAINDAHLALRYIKSNPNVTVVIPGMFSSDEVLCNIKAVSDTSPISDEERQRIAEIRALLGNNFCRRCNYCAPCTAGIQIPLIFLFDGYLTRYNLGEWAKDRYAALDVKASACTECGMCETRCPYRLPIRKMMKEAAVRFGK